MPKMVTKTYGWWVKKHMRGESTATTQVTFEKENSLVVVDLSNYDASLFPVNSMVSVTIEQDS